MDKDRNEQDIHKGSEAHFFFFLPKLYFHIRGIYKYYDRKYKSEKMSKLMGNDQMYNVFITVSYLRL